MSRMSSSHPSLHHPLCPSLIVCHLLLIMWATNNCVVMGTLFQCVAMVLRSACRSVQTGGHGSKWTVSW